MPSRGSDVDVKWNGGDIKRRFNRAIARGTISLTVRVADIARTGAHVITGDLRRSIHGAKVNSMGEQKMTQGNVLHAEGAMTEVGSWLDYACVEEARGGSHAYMMPAVQAVRGVTFATFRAAFKEEGF